MEAQGGSLRGLTDFLKFIRFSHTIFALPFALASMFAAAGGVPSMRTFAGIIVAMVMARTAAMTFNRVADWEIDKRNPRTAGRHRLVRRETAIAVCVVSSLGFVVAAWSLNVLCLILSPVALGIIFFYSLTKRFTDLAQLFLGLALAVAPVGAWIAVTGTLSAPPLILALAVLLWVTGFDLIYASQDYEIDLRDGLRSLVVKLGKVGAFRAAMALHAGAFVTFIVFGISLRMGGLYFSSLVVVLGALLFEHMEVRRGTVDSINRAFFVANAVVGIAFVTGVVLNCLEPVL